MTAPWQARAETDLRHAVLGMPVTCTYLPAAGAPMPLGLTGGRVTFDEGWTPHVQADLTVTAQSDALVDAIDPRTTGRVEVTAGYRYPGAAVPDVHVLADLGLRTREAERTGDGSWIMHLAAASDEALIQDVGAPDIYPGIDPWSASSIIAVRLAAFLGTSPSLTMQVPDTMLESAASKVGTPAWDVLQEWAALCGGTLVCQGDRSWVVRAWPTGAGAPVHWLDVGPAGTITAASATIDRDTWANEVWLDHRWDHGAGMQYATGVASVTAGPYAATAGNRRTLHTYADTPATNDQLTAAARATLTRRLRAGHTEQITARAAWWVRPGHTVMVRTSPGEPWRALLVSRVTFDLGAASMTLDLRRPDDTTIS